MGKIEKLVVLAVLFVSAIVVAVSVHGGGDEAGPQQPFGSGEVAAADGTSSTGGDSRAPASSQDEDGRSWIRDEVWNDRDGASDQDRVSGRRRSGQPADRGQTGGANGETSSGGSSSSETTETSGAGGSTDPDLLLSASGAELVKSDARNDGPTPGSTNTPAPFDGEGRPRILRADADVRDLGIGSFRSYTVENGDTWTSLSKRFFVGGAKHRESFQRQNETVTDLEEGQILAVPVYDMFSRAVERAPFEARPVREAGADSGDVSVADAGAAKVIEEGWYVVQDGDTLSDISQSVYGTSSRWREIYDANRTRLSGPDWLDVGVRLQIP